MHNTSFDEINDRTVADNEITDEKSKIHVRKSGEGVPDRPRDGRLTPDARCLMGVGGQQEEL